jgi:hypothetical protein
MRKIVSLAAAAALAAAPLPALAQTSSSQTDQQTKTAPGTGGVSKPGVSGKPGNKSGETVTPSGKVEKESSGSSMRRSDTAPSQDSTGVEGKPGSKSGRTVQPPGEKPGSDSTTSTKTR